jgi:hypothetical protein
MNLEKFSDKLSKRLAKEVVEPMVDNLLREIEKLKLQKMHNDADRVYLIKEKLRYVNQVKELRKEIKELKKGKGVK